MEKIDHYRAGRNIVRTGQIVKVTKKGKRPFLGKVTEIQSDDGETPTTVAVTTLTNMQGAVHGDFGKWHYYSPELVEVTDQNAQGVRLAMGMAK